MDLLKKCDMLRTLISVIWRSGACFCCLVLSACGPAEKIEIDTEIDSYPLDSTVPAVITEEEGYTFHASAYIRMVDTLDECVEKADYIVACTVAEVGETFLFDPSRTVTENSSDAQKMEFTRSIRTPVTLQIDEVFLDRKGTLGETLQILEYYGTYQGYTLTNDFPKYEEGHSYLLFIGVMPDGETNLVFPQASVELLDDTAAVQADGMAARNFTPLFHAALYEEIASKDALSAELTSAVTRSVQQAAS